MSVAQVAGAAIILLVFGGLFAVMAHVEGWRVTVGIWAASLAVVGAIALGSYLLGGGASC